MTRKRKTLISLDPVAAYAEGVLSGAILAGPHVRDAAHRHVEDVEHGPNRGLRWDLKAARRAIHFFRDVLKLNGGEWEGQPFALLPWQSFIVGSLFGWKLADGSRRYRIAYIETAKGSGKSPLAAGVGLYGLTADHEARAEIYSAATKKDQAMTLFRDAVAMVDQSPELRERIGKSGVGENVWNLAYRKTGSWFRAISADDGQSGPRPHVSLLDEIHEHRTAYMVETLRAGMKSRRQPMMVMITNAGSDPLSVCGTYHDYGAKVTAGTIEDDSFFAYICALDAGDAPLRDELCWPKVNPSLPALPGLKYLRDQVAQARGIPGKESIVRRLNFCEWVEAESPWISREAWEACADRDFDKNRLRGRKCWAGLDLSSTTDLTALALLFEPTPDDLFYRLVPFFWLPGDELADRAERDRVPSLLEWRNRGHLETPPGRAINKLAVAQRCAEIASAYSLQGIGFDRWRIEDFTRICEDEGLKLPLVPHGQGFKDMAPAVDEFERLIVDRRLRHDGNPVMNWCIANAVVQLDPAGNRKVTKERSTGRVDGVVAACMAVGRSTVPKPPPKKYQIVIV